MVRGGHELLRDGNLNLDQESDFSECFHDELGYRGKIALDECLPVFPSFLVEFIKCGSGIQCPGYEWTTVYRVYIVVQTL